MNVGEKLAESLPDYATLTVDPRTNQLIVVADVGVCQRLELLLEELDKVWN